MRTVFPHGAVLIANPKNNTKFKVNGQRLKPFLTTEPMIPDDSVLTLSAVGPMAFHSSFDDDIDSCSYVY